MIERNVESASLTRPSHGLDVGELAQRGDHPLLVADVPGDAGGVDQVLGGAPVRAADW